MPNKQFKTQSIFSVVAFAATALLHLLASTATADEPLPGGHYIFSGVEVRPINRTKVGGKINDAVSDELTYWIRFDIHPKFTIAPGTADKGFKIVNPTVAVKTKFTFDKPIEFNGEKVPAGTNLLKYKKFNGSFFNVSAPNLFPLAIHSATIRSGFHIPKDTYTVTFVWTTDKGEVLSDSVKVFIDVELPK